MSGFVRRSAAAERRICCCDPDRLSVQFKIGGDVEVSLPRLPTATDAGAIETSAAIKAGASFRPSLTIRTLLPDAFSSPTYSTLLAGRAPARQVAASPHILGYLADSHLGERIARDQPGETWR